MMNVLETNGVGRTVLMKEECDLSVLPTACDYYMTVNNNAH